MNFNGLVEQMKTYFSREPQCNGSNPVGLNPVGSNGPITIRQGIYPSNTGRIEAGGARKSLR